MMTELIANTYEELHLKMALSGCSDGDNVTALQARSVYINVSVDPLYNSRLHLTDSESSPGLRRQDFLFRQRHTVHERVHRRLAITPTALM